MKCATCGEEHDLLDPTFLRPDAVVRLPAEERARVQSNNDLCRIRSVSGLEQDRYFVRCVLPVPLLDAGSDIAWGLWVEVVEADFRRVLDTWSDPDQASQPPMDAQIANQIPGYPNTLGLPVCLRLTGPTTRPEVAFAREVDHQFARECVHGVDVHKALEWLEAMT